MSKPQLAAICFAAMIVAVLYASSAEAQPLNHVRQYPAPVRLAFHGKIDGSEVIEITATHAHSTHRHWSWPSKGVILNDVVWHPQGQRSLENAGKTRYLFRPV